MLNINTLSKTFNNKKKKFYKKKWVKYKQKVFVLWAKCMKIEKNIPFV